jgi:Replication initiator protein, pSAM2/FtsK/SpoIIIE family
MTDQPARVTPGEISTFLDQLRAITPDTPLQERIRFFERKAHLLPRIAAHLDTAESHRVAAGVSGGAGTTNGTGWPCHHRPPRPGVPRPGPGPRARQGAINEVHRPGRRPARLRPGPADFANRAENLAHGFGALLCRVHSARPGFLILEFVRRDALAAIIPALAIPEHADLKALAIGRREDGSPWLVRLHGTHLLVAGATGAGKGSILWSLIRALLGLLQAGLVRVLAADPKVMELAYGRAIFDRYGQYAADPAAIVAMLEAAVTDMRATLASICPPCAERAKMLRAIQCREGWHLEDEPDPGPPAPDETQEHWLLLRAEAQVRRDRAEASGEDTNDLDELIGELDTEITRSGVRGSVTSYQGSKGSGKAKARRSRSTRRRQDAAPLPKRKIAPQTVGRVFTTPDGKSYRPSMFLTLTCDSYGKVRDDSTPFDPGTYDYQRAARDALHFSALADRFIQNLRRTLGYDAQYFGAVEPQRRLAPHLHMAIRGAVPRAVIRQVIAATYHQVWWPSTDIIQFEDDNLPVWDEATRNYLDPATGEVLTTWDQALDAIGQHDEPLHVARFGPEFRAEGVLAGSKDAARCIRYLTKYLTKQVADCHQADTAAQRAHMDRLAEALRYEPCSPTCANWLRYGIQPKNARPGLRPGLCKGKAHRPEHMGYAGRRVLTSRKWSGKTRPTTAAITRPGSSRRLAWTRPIRPATAGMSSPRPTTTTCHRTSACFGWSWSARGGKPRSRKQSVEPAKAPQNFRQRRRRLHDGGQVGSTGGAAADRR